MPGKKMKSCQPLVQTDSAYATSYMHFKEFLQNNYTALEAMAEVEQAYHGGESLRLADIHESLGKLLGSVKGMAANMQALGGDRYAPLQRLVERIGREVLAELQPLAEKRKELVLPLKTVTAEMISYVGAKAANMGIMASELELPVPNGFAVTSEGFRMVLRENRLRDRFQDALADLDLEQTDAFKDTCEALQQAILEAEVPQVLAKAIGDAFEELENEYGPDLRVAVRSSAVGEDGRISFAGQYVSVLGVGKETLLDAYQQVLVGKYSPRAITYRLQNNLGDDETPMCVLILAMVDARAAGVVYSMNPSGEQERQGADRSASGSGAVDSNTLMVSAVWGLGETLVSGENSPDVYLVDKKDFSILRRDISRKEKQLILLADGGTKLVDVDEDLQEQAVLSDAHIQKLARYGAQLEQYFQSPQDIEWAMDQNGRLLLLQARPLKVVASDHAPKAKIDHAAHPVLLTGGKTASIGIAAGKAFVAGASADIDQIPENSILVVRTTSPEYARYMHRIQGLVTDMGGVGSHLASVAREYGIPAIVDAKEATSKIEHGWEVTMDAGTATVYQGRIQEWVDSAKLPQAKRAMHGPMHQRLETVLEKITPLNLMDPKSERFAPEHCRTIHDVIRYLHERSIGEMFAIAEDQDAHDRHPAAELRADIPLRIRLIDLGGGLRDGLTECDAVTPEDIRSVPLRALWQGLTHPGLNWSSSVDLSLRNLAGLMSSGAAGDAQQIVGQDSYALVAEEYLNLSAKFGYHYANLDVLCSEAASQNYVSFQFSGGAGSYYGKSLRILLLAEILERLEFRTELKGDYITAVLKGFDASVLLEKLDQMGRLLACSRLLDVALKDEADVQRLTEMFFAGDYDFMARKPEDAIRNFYVREGHWTRAEEGGETICRQVGTRIVDPVSSGLACLLGRVTGDGYHSFLETIKAYSYFPLAIAKDSKFSSGVLEVKARCESGCIDMAAGLVFGLRNAGNYFVFRIDALKNTATLFGFEQGIHAELTKMEMEFNADQWYKLAVTVHRKHVSASVDERIVLEYNAPTMIQGYCGLWSKADSVVAFKAMGLRTEEGERSFVF